jgi:glucokinase
LRVVEHVLAVDVGGTKLSAGVVRDDGRLVERLDAPTLSGRDGDALFGELARLIDGLDEAPGAVAVGVGCGGPMTRGGEAVSPLNIPAWRGFPLRARLASHTGLPTFVDNDAKALALGEGWIGAARGARDFIGMVVSTGVGGGIVLDGRLLDGNAGNAGHVGHMIVEPDGHLCACGARGCLEAEASGTAIAKISGRPASEADAATIARTGTMVGRGIASVANLLDLPLAVVAGSVALGFGAPFFTAAQRELDARCRIEFARGTRVVPAALGDRAPLIGAAQVALSRFA